jgi:type 1 glutamine amidotransferase
MRVLILAILLCAEVLAGDLPRILFFSNPMSSDNDVIRRTDPNVLSVAETNFARIAKGVFEVTLTQRGADVTAEKLKGFDAIVFFAAINPPDVDVEGLVAWVKAGGAFVAIHSTANTYQGHAGFGELLGARFEKRPWRTREAPQTKMRIVVNDATHPATRHLPKDWALADDLYVFKNFDAANNRPLLSLDAKSLDMTKLPGQEAPPVSWARAVGKGRMFYTALGDWEPTWRDPLYERHLVEGIWWAMGKRN